MPMNRLLIVLVMASFLLGCAATRYAKRAAEFEAAGLYKDASEFYYKSVLKNQNKVETKLGLQRTGQFVLNEQLSTFSRYYKNNENQDAVYSYLEAQAFYDKLQSVNVTLNFSDQYHVQYKEMKDSYVSGRYVEGSEKLNREEFEAAAEIFGEIITIQDDYKNVKELHAEAVYEPIYRSAIRTMELSKYRAAYWLFNGILTEVESYKNTLELKNEAQKLANINIIVPDIRDRYKERKVTVQQVVNVINNLNNPFITVMDRSTVDDKQLYNSNGEFNLVALNLLGFDAVMQVEVISAIGIEGKVKVEDRPAYLKEVIKYTDEAGEAQTRNVYHKISYQTYSKTNQATVKMAYTFTDTRTGAILLSDSFVERREETTEFGRYKGELKNVVPGYWVLNNRKSPEDKIKDNNSAIRNLHQFLKASDKITYTDVLVQNAINGGLGRLAKAIDQYDPER